MTENVWHTDRMLILIFSGVFFALDVCGTSFVKNDLVYIENDIVELPSAKKQLTLILTVVDDEAKVIASTESIRAASMLRSALAPASYPMEDDMIEKFIKKARRDVFPAVRSLTNALSKDIT